MKNVVRVRGREELFLGNVLWATARPPFHWVSLSTSQPPSGDNFFCDSKRKPVL
jgi:hypothetical protein